MCKNLIKERGGYPRCEVILTHIGVVAQSKTWGSVDPSKCCVPRELDNVKLDLLSAELQIFRRASLQDLQKNLERKFDTWGLSNHNELGAI